MADTARLEDDSPRPRAARLSRAQAVGHRAQEPRDGARRRRGAGAVLRTEPHPEEELSQRVLLAHYAQAHQRPARRLALSGARRPGAVPRPILRPRLPLVPYHGAHPSIERHYVSKRSRRQPSVLVFSPRTADARAFCYADADLRKGEESQAVFGFLAFWQRIHGALPTHLVFDSRLTTYAGLARLDAMGVSFITLRRRSPKILTEIRELPASAWRRYPPRCARAKVPNPPRVGEEGHARRLPYAPALHPRLGHDQPTVLVTNDTRTPKTLITRYAQRMLIAPSAMRCASFISMPCHRRSP